jgi:hypothetical protein
MAERRPIRLLAAFGFGAAGLLSPVAFAQDAAPVCAGESCTCEPLSPAGVPVEVKAGEPCPVGYVLVIDIEPGVIVGSPS